MILAKIGERLYEFKSQQDLGDAREIYANCMGNQNAFETELEEAGIEFTLELQ